MKLNYLHKRDEVYYFRRAIPAHLRHKFGNKCEFVYSLGTKNPELATASYHKMDKKYDSILKLAAQDPDFVGATEFKRLAADVGISAFPDDVEAVPVSDLIEVVGANLDAIQSLPSDPKVRAGALASALNSKLKIEEIYTRYKEITRDKDLKRTPREFQKAHKPIELAMTELVETIGDLDVRKLTKRDAYRFRDKLISDVSIKKITASTANKKIMHLRKIVSAVFEVDYPELPNPFQIKGIEDSVRGHRKAFSESEIEEITLRLKSSTMNDELKAIIFVAMYTGAGCKELALLTSSDIVLDAEIPYIKIDANEFRVKVKSGGDRHREIPLYGEALAWMKRFPNGFARYRRDNGGETVSATARKFLKQYTGKTFYCFRHRLADLLRNSGCEDRLANAILGHKQGVIGNHYGNGYTLKSKYNALAQAHEKGRADLEKDQNIDKL